MERAPICREPTVYQALPLLGPRATPLHTKKLRLRGTGTHLRITASG